jgi:hypothetical protein
MAITSVNVHLHDEKDISVSQATDGSTAWINLGNVAIFIYSDEVGQALQRAVTTLRGYQRRIESDKQWEAYKAVNP